MENSQYPEALFRQLETFLEQQEALSRQVNELRQALAEYRQQQVATAPPEAAFSPEAVSVPSEPVPETPMPESPVAETALTGSVPETIPEIPEPAFSVPEPTPGWMDRFRVPREELEKFVGENLVSKIGILITIIGVAIGAKYSIENNLISPVMRIVLGYLIGGGLLAVGMRLKAKYEDYSAVLVSGAIAIFYFLTYAAYSFYSLMPQVLAFVLMVVFTAFAVFTALRYNRQVIALIGLVGAYAIPFLLSDGSGRVAVLFTYMAVINSGILVIALRKLWKPVYVSSFALTWLVFGGWALSQYQSSQFGLAMGFATVFFLLFYGVFLGYPLRSKVHFDRTLTLLLLLNAFVYYGLGYAFMNDHPEYGKMLGIFTLLNATLHFGVARFLYRRQLPDKNLFYLIAGLVLVFATMAIPVQLNGNWVTLLWILEAAMLFWVGRTRGIALYEKISYPVFILAFFSLMEDWQKAYNFIYLSETAPVPFLNVNFATTLLFSVLTALAIRVHYRHADQEPQLTIRKEQIPFHRILLGLFLLVTYTGVFQELGFLFETGLNTFLPNTSKELYLGMKPEILGNARTTAQLAWTMFFAMGLLRFLPHQGFSGARRLPFFGGLLLVLALFLTSGLYHLSELRDSSLSATGRVPAAYYLLRYASIALAVGMGINAERYWRQYLQPEASPKTHRTVMLGLHLALLWVLSSELLSWMALGGVQQNYKLGLSILWGSYAVFLVMLGIRRHRQYLRVGGIALFGITLAKLFLYDLTGLNMISRTIVFVTLGILLLFISFLYNKFKSRIGDGEKD